VGGDDPPGGRFKLRRLVPPPGRTARRFLGNPSGGREDLRRPLWRPGPPRQPGGKRHRRLRLGDRRGRRTRGVGGTARTALGVLVKARHLRPQAARSLAPDAQARILATVLDPGEPLSQGLLVSLHLGHRRALLGAFLDALSLPHEDGVLKEEADAAPPVTPEKAKAAVGTLASFPAGEVRTYLNTLWLQDPERWGALEGADGWLPASS